LASIRKTKTASGATAVQVVRYAHERIEVLKHMGSAHDEAGLAALVGAAQRWYAEHTAEGTLFGTPAVDTALVAEGVEFLGATHQLAYSTLMAAAKQCGFPVFVTPTEFFEKTL